MNLEEGMKKGLEIYANKCLKDILKIDITDYTYGYDFSDDTVEFHTPHDSVSDTYYPEIEEIREFLNDNVTSSYRFGDFVKAAYMEAKNDKIYGADIYGKIHAEIIRAEKEGVEPLLTSDDYKVIIDLIKEHRQLEKDKNINKNEHEYER